MYPYNFRRGQKVQTDAPGVAADRAFPAHVIIPATQAVAADDDGVATLTLGAEVQSITEGITSPAWPRALTVDGNVAGVVGDVVITGTNFAGEEITETIALNETTLVSGAKAFKTITKIDLPVQAHAAVLQVETATAVGTVTTSGNASVTVTSALLDEAEVVLVPVVEDDDAAAIALAIRTALAASEVVAEHFAVSGDAAAVILTAKVAAANDATLNIAIADGAGEGASVGVTTAATSANTTAGVVADVVVIGWNDVLGLPYLLTHNTIDKVFLDNVLEGTAATVVTDVDELEKNTIDLHSALDGTIVDIYLIV